MLVVSRFDTKIFQQSLCLSKKLLFVDAFSGSISPLIKRSNRQQQQGWLPRGAIRTNSISSWFGFGSTPDATKTTNTPKMIVTDADIDTSSSTTKASAETENNNSDSVSSLPSIDSMTGREMKMELESYGISTKALFEKSEYRTALEKARIESGGRRPQSTSTTAQSSAENSTSSTSISSLTRDEQIRAEMTICQTMAARDMKRELENVHGISTRSLFEKSEFVRALAEARVDGITTKTNDNNNKSTSAASNTNKNTEGYAEYTNVEVLTDDSSGPRQKGTEPKQQPPQQAQKPMDPFAGVMDGMMGGGGGGGMGGFANLFNTMGGVGNASPFGSGGGNPFGNAGGGDNMMGKVREMMSNPKVMAIMQKAQGNPRIMAKVQECMSNPTAMLKYQNDPEVAELIRELQPYLK